MLYRSPKANELGKALPMPWMRATAAPRRTFFKRAAPTQDCARKSNRCCNRRAVPEIFWRNRLSTPRLRCCCPGYPSRSLGVRLARIGSTPFSQIVCFPRLAREGEDSVLFRRVEILDAEKQETIVFLTNLLAFGATTIAAIYKDRWQVELFFKALKQTLKIKTFVGTSANAVRTQVWTALIAMLVLKYLQLKSTFSWSLSNLAALLRQQLFFYRDLWVWLDDPFQAPPALAGLHDDAQQLAITW
jgi:hypothetical protein